MKTSEKNKNLDLRRWGKNQYTKALSSASDSGSDSDSSSGPLSSYEDFLVRIIYNVMYLAAEDFDQVPDKTDWSEEWIRENVVLPDAIEMGTFLTNVPQAEESENYTGYCGLLVPSDTELPMDMFIGNGGDATRPVYTKDTQLNPAKWYMANDINQGIIVIAPGAVLEDYIFQHYYPAHFTDGVLQWSEDIADVYKEFRISDESNNG